MVKLKFKLSSVQLSCLNKLSQVGRIEVEVDVEAELCKTQRV